MHINNKNDIQFAALWITACINLHAFAVDHEDDTYMMRDVFYKKGLKIARKECKTKAARERRQLWEGYEADNDGEDKDKDDDVGLLEGKLK